MSLRVSIVTPSLNQGAYIQTAIESVLTQNYQHLEYIVMDGSSTDNTVQILQQYGERLRFVSEPDGGQSAAINRGWQLTQGDIIAWVNADDFLQPGTINAAVEALEKHPEVAFVYGDCDYINEAGKVTGRYDAQPYDYAALVKSATNFIPSIALFMRRSAVEKIGLLDQTLHYMMDYDLCLKLGRAHKGLYLPQSFAAMRLHTSAKSLRALAGFGDELVMILERFFASTADDHEIAAWKSEAMSHAKLKAAHAAYWSGKPERALSWLNQLDRANLSPHSQTSAQRLRWFSRLGKPGLRLVETVFGNPYLR